MEDLVRSIRTIRRLWPLVRTLQAISPPLRDLFRGLLWEEAGQLAGAVMTQRHGTTSLWGIAIVAVLPDYRRRGIARRLLARSVEELRERGAEKASLSVIDQNVPAYSLYESLGFVHYGGMIEYETSAPAAASVPSLPDGYVVEPAKHSRSWRIRYDLDRRINPPELTEYEPVVIGRYRPPAVIRPILPLIHWLERREQKLVRVRQTRDGQVVALARYDVPKREGGVSSIRVFLDPACPELADYLVAYHVERAAKRAPGRRIDFFIPDWMTAVIDAAERYGFRKRIHYHNLGLTL